MNRKIFWILITQMQKNHISLDEAELKCNVPKSMLNRKIREGFKKCGTNFAFDEKEENILVETFKNFVDN